MEIKGPAGTPPVDIEQPIVRPTTATAPIPKITASQGQPSTVQLSPALFQAGQLLNAIVIKIEQNQALLLKLLNPVIDGNGQKINIQLRAAMPYPVKEGQHLTLQVKSLNQGQPVLNIISDKNIPATAQVHLHTALLNQKPTGPLLANIAELQLQQPGQKKLLQSFPQEVRERIQTLWRSLPDTMQIQKSHGLKQAIGHSGLFLESQLAKADQPGSRTFPAMDVRTGLLRLAEAIKAQLGVMQRNLNQAQQKIVKQITVTENPKTGLTSHTISDLSSPAKITSGSVPNRNSPEQTSTAMPAQNKPPHPNFPQSQARAQPTILNMGTEQMLDEILTQTESGLARILTQQLQTQSSDPQRPSWMLELPVRHENGVDIFDMRIQREPDNDGSDAEQANHQWTVMLAFDLEGMGPVRVQITLLNDEISTFWWADKPDTVAMFQQHIEILKTRLKTVGLAIDKMDCHCGIPSTESVTPTTPYSNTMLDEEV